MSENVYWALTRAFNEGRLRAVLSSGQAVVMHRLAVMSKDGDWILREEDEALTHVRNVLSDRGARYRFGAPLDRRWMAGGWSAHFEFRAGPIRARTDFVTRPPRIDSRALEGLWQDAERASGPIPFVDVGTLIELKKTNRERDYAVIGELARLLDDPFQALQASRSARDLLDLAQRYPALVERAALHRPALNHLREGREALEAALDAERRALIRANELRLQRYMDAARGWADAWPEVNAATHGLPLAEAHRHVVACAERWLPFRADPV